MTGLFKVMMWYLRPGDILTYADCSFLVLALERFGQCHGSITWLSSTGPVATGKFYNDMALYPLIYEKWVEG
jgi:hypothetical protein